MLYQIWKIAVNLLLDTHKYMMVLQEIEVLSITTNRDILNRLNRNNEEADMKESKAASLF
jgi:hypothetical protein